MLKSMSIHQRDNSNGTIKSNFVTLCLAFKGSMPTLRTCDHEICGPVVIHLVKFDICS